jgi:membrane protein
VREFLDDDCPNLAASIAYRVLFSIFPLAIVLAGIFGIVVDATGLRADVVEAIVDAVPLSPDGHDELERLLDRATGGLGALGFLGVIGLLWAASGMMTAIRTALVRAWDIEDRRPFVRGKLVDVLLVLAGGLVVGLSLALSVATRAAEGAAADLLDRIGLGSGGVSFLVSTGAPFVLALGATLFLYRVVPPHHPRLAHIAPAAVLVAAGFVALQVGFGVYLRNVADYNAVYGSLGAVIAFLLFVYAASALFLLGAEVASELPRTRLELARGLPEPSAGPLRARVKKALLGLVARERG